MQVARLPLPLGKRLRATEELGVVGALVVLCLLLALSTDSFLRGDNLLDVSRQASDFGIMAVGMVFLLAMGEIDLSVGAVLTLVGVVTALLLRAGVPESLALLLGVATGALCGLVNGLLAVLLRIPSIIITLGTMSIFRGLALVLSDAKPIANFHKGALFQLGADGVLGVPTGVLVMLAVCGLAHVALHHLPFGWRLQAIGSSPRSARFSGIAIARYRVLAMTLMGTIAGIAGITALTFLEAQRGARLGAAGHRLRGHRRHGAHRRLGLGAGRGAGRAHHRGHQEWARAFGHVGLLGHDRDRRHHHRCGPGQHAATQEGYFVMNVSKVWSSIALLLLLGACNKTDAAAGTAASSGSAAASVANARPKIGYVLHVLNDFTESIKRGAQDAGQALGADVDVQGPAGSSAQDAIAIFEGMVQRRLDGLVVVPAPGEVWVSPIRRAMKASIPVLTANITSTQSEAPAWFGQDEYQSGVLLAESLIKSLGARAAQPGKVVVGICHPGLSVLTARYDGVVKGLGQTKLEVSQPRDVTVPNTTNYAAWESLTGANPDAVAFVGLCSMDVPNLAKLKARGSASWLVAGYDLNQESLDALKTGKADLLLGQNPYLQGYLPVRALVEHLKSKQPLPKGWVDVGTELVTAQNVGEVYAREVDRDVGRKSYAERLGQRFVDLAALAKPMPAER